MQSRCLPSLFKTGAFICAFFAFMGPLLKADDENKGVVAGGVVFNIASDRQVKSIGGIVQPEPLDLYLKRIMDGMTERLERIEKKVDTVMTDLENLKTRPPVPTPIPSPVLPVKK